MTGIPSVDDLAARARAGDRRAAARLRSSVEPDARGLAAGLVGSRREARRLVRTAMTEALGDTERPYASAVLVAISRSTGAGAAPEATPEQRLQQAVGVLVDVQGRTHADAAALLDLPVERVRALHRQGREEMGLSAGSTDCHGWHLVSRMDELTAPEQAAGRRHLEGCRRCTDALAARAAARTRLKAALPVGGTALGALALAGFSTLTGTTAATVGVVGSVTAGVVSVPVVIHERPPRPPAAVQHAAAGHSDALHTLSGSRRAEASRRSAPPSPTDLPGTTRAVPVALAAPSPSASAQPSPQPSPAPSPQPSRTPAPSAAPSPSLSPSPSPSSPAPAPELLGVPLPVLPPVVVVLPSLLPLPSPTVTPSASASPLPGNGRGNGRGNGNAVDKYRGSRSASPLPSPLLSPLPSPAAAPSPSPSAVPTPDDKPGNGYGRDNGNGNGKSTATDG